MVSITKRKHVYRDTYIIIGVREHWQQKAKECKNPTLSSDKSYRVTNRTRSCQVVNPPTSTTIATTTKKEKEKK